MCFGAKNKDNQSNSSVLSDPMMLYQYWKPPQIESPNVRLHEDIFGKKALKKKREGLKRFQIPVTSQSNRQTGLSIPTPSSILIRR
mgnify:CR=1 FL=1